MTLNSQERLVLVHGHRIYEELEHQLGTEKADKMVVDIADQLAREELQRLVEKQREEQGIEVANG